MGISIVVFIIILFVSWIIDQEQQEQRKKNTTAASKEEIQRLETEKAEAVERKKAANCLKDETVRKAVDAKALELYEMGQKSLSNSVQEPSRETKMGVISSGMQSDGKLYKKKEQENAQRKRAKRLTIETAEKAAEEKAEELHGNGRIKADPLEKSKELESQPTENLQTVVEEYKSAQSSSANSGSTLEEIQRRVNEYEKAAIAAKDAGKIKSAGLFVKLFHDEDAMKEIARSTMIGIFMLLKYELAEARTTYDDLMKELNRTYTYVNMERLDRQDSGNCGNS